MDDRPGSTPDPSTAWDILCPQLGSSRVNELEALGMMTWLWSQSSLHESWPVSLLTRHAVPAIKTHQFLLARDREQNPRLLITWARMSDEAERRYIINPNQIRPEDWTSGPNLWFIDWISPLGGSLAILPPLRNRLFANDVGHVLRVKKGRDAARIVHHFGANLGREHRRKAQARMAALLLSLQTPPPDPS